MKEKVVPNRYQGIIKLFCSSISQSSFFFANFSDGKKYLEININKALESKLPSVFSRQVKKL
jgi:hypothetical protein